MRPFELVDGFDGAVLDHVVDVAAKQGVGVQGVLHDHVQRQVLMGEQIADGERSLDRVDAGVGQGHVSSEFVDQVMQTLAGNGAPRGRLRVGQTRFIGLPAGDHQRDAGFVDQDGVGFVDHGGCKRAVDLLADREGELVAEIVESDLVGSGVGDIAGVGALALFDAQPCWMQPTERPKNS